MTNPKEEKTLLLIKPDGVKRGLIGEVIKRIEQRGLKIIALKMLWPTRQQIDEHYPKDATWIKRLGEKAINNLQSFGYDPKEKLGKDDPEEIGQEIREWLFNYMTSGPIVAMVIEGVYAIRMVRKICGKTIPAEAEMGTIRGDYSCDGSLLANLSKRAIHNLVHASETPEEAEKEIKHWFSLDELYSYKRSEEDIMF